MISNEGKLSNNTVLNKTRIFLTFINYYQGFYAITGDYETVQDSTSMTKDRDNWVKFDFENANSFERTVPAYCCIGGAVIKGKSWARILVAIVEFELANKNPVMEDLYKQPLNKSRSVKPFLLEERIDGLNCSQLSNGYWLNTNYNIPRIITIIQSLLLRCGYNKDQIELYGITKVNSSEKDDNSSLKQKISERIDMQVEKIVKDAGRNGVTIQKVVNDLYPGTSFLSTKNALDNNLNIIAMPNDRFVHVDSFVDLDEAEVGIGKILNTHFAQFDGYSNVHLLFGAALKELSLFLNDNDCENENAVYAIARYLFEKKTVARKPFFFSMPHIFDEKPDFPISMKGLMIRLARNNDGILHEDDAKSFLQKTKLPERNIGQILKIGTDATFLIYDENKYLLSEALGIDDAWCNRMHDRVDDLFRQANVAYVIPRDIKPNWLSTLPVLPHNLEWTCLFLQEILDKYPSIGFKSISADVNQSHHTLSAAFVPVNSPLQSFPDVVTLFMEDKYKLPMRILGEELRLDLRKAGMLENDELSHALPKALDDYRFAWIEDNKYVYVRGNK